MRKAIMGLILGSLLIGTNCFAILGTPETVWDNETLITGTTVTSTAIDIGSYGADFGIWIKATATTGTPYLTVTYEESYVLPTTEGLADDNWATPYSASNIFTNRTDETPFIEDITPVPMKYIRFEASNPANATGGTVILNMKLFKQED